MSTAISRIKKGKEFENYVADRLKATGVDLRAYRSHGSGSGTREKADIWTNASIFGRNLGIECKNQKTLSIPAWWKQTKMLQLYNREPILAFKIHNEPYEETKVVVYLDTLLDLIRHYQKTVNAVDIEQDNIDYYKKQDSSYKIDHAIQVLKEAKKLLNK